MTISEMMQMEDEAFWQSAVFKNLRFSHKKYRPQDRFWPPRPKPRPLPVVTAPFPFEVVWRVYYVRWIPVQRQVTGGES